MTRFKVTGNKDTAIQQSFAGSNRSRTHIDDVESCDQRPQTPHTRLTQLTHARDRIITRRNGLRQIIYPPD